MSLMKLLFIGMPGAGKGTQAKLLSKYNIKHISTGDLIREAFKKKDSLIISYKKKIEAGGFLPDELIFQLIEQNIDSLEEFSGYVLDGAVRTLEQAKFAVEKKLIDAVIFFNLSEEIAIERLVKRRDLENRADDNEEAIKMRFNQYRKKTEPVLEYLKQNVKYLEIDASPTREEIHKEVVKQLELN